MLNNAMAMIRRDANGTHRVFCKRDKYKHWHELGRHRETDIAFQRALRAGTLVWSDTIKEHFALF